ncbi:thiamine phosphate synthase [Gryllotalpicola reticulitermitis]|uniref:Thiamine-phosphate synthase n=1 Tax=Gryllotalpicola reticulitermitis TaxID=1184153 RepID=A0ABV8Q6B6_9MICO
MTGTTVTSGTTGTTGMTGFDLSTYLVTDSASAGSRGVLDIVRAATSGGVTAVQLREKNASARGFYELVLRAAELTAGRAALIVNDRVDVFLAARAAGARVDGVHVGQSDLPVTLVRRLIGPAAILGLTANTPAQLRAVAALPDRTVDYLGVGVIRATRTKPDHPEPLGTAGFGALAATTPLPCVAIGGVTVADTVPLRRAGAAGLAVASAVCAAEDPQAAARELAHAWRAAA